MEGRWEYGMTSLSLEAAYKIYYHSKPFNISNMCSYININDHIINDFMKTNSFSSPRRKIPYTYCNIQLYTNFHRN